MKYIVILGDGMADLPIEALGNKTPLQYAKKPNMDFIATHGEVGLVKTVPENMSPGSDIANLSVLGYDPGIYYTGRSPLEAVSIGIDLSPTDVALRCNLVSLSEAEDSYRERSMIDYSSDEISTEEASELIAVLEKELAGVVPTEKYHFYTGISYRHCMIWEEGKTELSLTPPHNITDKNINPFVPQTAENSFLLQLMEKSYEILRDHPINHQRRNKGLRPANSIWLWGEGKKPALPLYKDLFGVTGSMISAVDLLKGIGQCSGLHVVNVEGATGNIHTNFSGKAIAALKELQSGRDFVFIHIEAPDECGHRGELMNKVRSIELIDEKILGYLLPNLEEFDAYRILLLPDHPTPIALKTHTSDPVPYVLYSKGGPLNSHVIGYEEHGAKETGIFESVGHHLIRKLFA